METAAGVGKFLYERALVALGKKLEHDVVDENIRSLITSDIESIKNSLDALTTADLNTSIDHMGLGLDLYWDDKRGRAKEKFKEAQNKAVEAMNTVLKVEQLIEATRVFCLCAVYEDLSENDGQDMETALTTCINRLKKMFTQPKVLQPLQVKSGIGISNKIREKFAKEEREKLCAEVYTNSTSLALFFKGKGHKPWPYIKLSNNKEIHSVVNLRKGELSDMDDVQETKYIYRNYPPHNGSVEVLNKENGSVRYLLKTVVDGNPASSGGHLITFKSEQPTASSWRRSLTTVEVRREDDLQTVTATLKFRDRYKETAELPDYADPTGAVCDNLVCVGTWNGHLSLWDTNTQMCVWEVDLKRINRPYQVKEIRFADDKHIVLTLNKKGVDKMYTVSIGVYSEQRPEPVLSRETNEMRGGLKITGLLCSL